MNYHRMQMQLVEEYSLHTRHIPVFQSTHCKVSFHIFHKAHLICFRQHIHERSWMHGCRKWSWMCQMYRHSCWSKDALLFQYIHHHSHSQSSYCFHKVPLVSCSFIMQLKFTKKLVSIWLRSSRHFLGNWIWCREKSSALIMLSRIRMMPPSKSLCSRSHPESDVLSTKLKSSRLTDVEQRNGSNPSPVMLTRWVSLTVSILQMAAMHASTPPTSSSVRWAAISLLTLAKSRLCQKATRGLWFKIALPLLAKHGLISQFDCLQQAADAVSATASRTRDESSIKLVMYRSKESEML